MFSYILVVSTGYILSISICPMFKAGKANFFKAMIVRVVECDFL